MNINKIQLFSLLKFSFLGISPVILAVVSLLFFGGCKGKKGDLLPDPGFSRYITSFTSGEISVEAPVTVRLAEIPSGVEPGTSIPGGLFELSPPVKGDVVADASGLFTFRPAEPLQPGTRYTVSFNLSRLLEVEKPFHKFRFSFNTRSQHFTVEEDGLYADASLDYRGMSYSGTVITADVADQALTEKIVEVRYNGKPVSLSWSHSPDRLRHIFTADTLMRDETGIRKMVISWEGKPLKVKQKGEFTVEVPPVNQFTVVGVKQQTTPEQQVVVLFSDPLTSDQAIEGMAAFDNEGKYTWQVDGNRLILWPLEKITGESKLTLFRGIRSADGKRLAETQTFTLFFRNLKPEVRLLGKGVIVPEEGSLVLPFEAVSLNAIDLRIIRVYASNVRQFLQENQVDGESDIKKTGRLVYTGKVELTPDRAEQLHQWNTYRLDLNRYVKPEQGAIYRVELRFRKAYSLYACEDDDSFPLAEEEEPEDWDSPGWYSLYYYPDGYDWEERDNPCHASYYHSGRFVSRNIYASNLGMVAKEGKGFRYTVVVTNLKTAQPEEKVEVSLYSLQHQLLGKAYTDKRGFATLEPGQKPFVAVANKGGQTGYLRIDDGSSLSLSNFDVSGEEVREGVKGFIYGERGVWRPGDQLFLTFILDDPEGRIPRDAPVLFRLINSRGQEVEKQVATHAENGFYQFPVKTRSDDPTGNWYARVQAGGATFEKRIKIETVKPNRLKATLQLPLPVQSGVRQQGRLNAAWLHGAEAPSLKAVVETEMFPMETTFPGYEKYTFHNPAAVYFTSKQTLFEGRLDEHGQVLFPLEFPANASAPGKLKAWFTTRIFEEGGDFSTFVQEAEFSPYPKYLGIRMPEEEDGWYQTGKLYQPELVALSPEGKGIPLGSVEVSLYKIDWRWWWESGDDYLARYVSGRQFQPIKRWMLDGSALKAQIDLKVDYHDWRDNGRYLLFARDTENGHGTGVTFYMSEWGGWRTDAMPEGATILSLQTDKEKYSPGEKIRVTLPSQAGGELLVSLEDGKQVKDIFWVKAGENETVFEVAVKPGMAPTLYIHVTLIQPYGSTRNDAPIRLYGVKAVKVEDPATLLQPVVTMNNELEPEKEFQVVVSEEKGNPMTYTLAIVDEGLLDITGFRTPDPHAHFYAREALGVKTYDLYDYVAGAYGASLEKSFAIGGDEDRRIAGSKEANRFQPVVLYAGPYTLSKGKRTTHRFRMPNYVGSVKAMVIAGHKGAYGSAAQTAAVRKTVMLLATLPRVAGPGEEFSLPVEVFAMKESTRNVSVSVEAGGNLAVSGEQTKQITFSRPGSQVVWFRVKASMATGIGKVKVTATSGSDISVSETELEVRNPNSPVMVEKSALIESGKSWSETVTAPGMPGTREAFLELSAIPGLNLSRHLDNLVSYPHGCAEQTVSVALGQLFLENLIQLPAEEKSRIEENVRQALQSLLHMQTSTGGFASWPGQNSANDWNSSYAGHFITLAAQKGYTIPAGMKNRWLSYQLAAARNWRPSPAADPFVRREEALIQAYRLYSLALAGSPEAGVMNRFREEVKDEPQARWRLAAAYALTGQPAAARQLLEQLQPFAEEYPGHGATFGSKLRDKAMMLETLLLLNDRKQAFPLLAEMAAEIGNSSWLSTQSAAWSFYSISRFFAGGTGTGNFDAKIGIQGKEDVIRSASPVRRIPVKISGDGKIAVKVENTGTAPLYARVAARGVPLEDTTGVVSNNLRMRTVFTGKTGKTVDPSSLPQGSDLFLEVTVTHPGTRGPYKDLVLATVFPSGWEILHNRLTDIPTGPNRHFEYQDYRDDRVYTYFNLATGESKTFRFALNSSYAGRFFMPALVCEGMYDHSTYVREPGKWVTVNGK